MRRYLPSRRSRSNTIDTNQLRDEFIRQLSKEAEALLQQLTTQFSESLQTQVTQAYQGIVAGDTPSVSPTGDPGTIGSIGQVLSTGARYLISRPKTSRESSETQRSISAGAQLRSSTTQTAEQAQLVLGRADKNL